MTAVERPRLNPAKYNYLFLICLDRGSLVGREFGTVKGMMGSLLNSVGAQFIKLPYSADLDTQGLWRNGRQQAVMYQCRFAGDSADASGLLLAIRKLARDNGAFAGVIKLPTLGVI